MLFGRLCIYEKVFLDMFAVYARKIGPKYINFPSSRPRSIIAAGAKWLVFLKNLDAKHPYIRGYSRFLL